MKLYFLDAAKNPFDAVKNFLQNTVIEGFLDIAIPIAVLGFISLGIGAMMATDEHARQKFKSGMLWLGVATIVVVLAKSFVPWIQNSIK